MPHRMGIVVILLLCIFLLIVSIAYIRWFGTIAVTKGVPTIAIFPVYKRLLKQHMNISSTASLMDLGCGTGGALRFFSTTYTCKQLDGVDLNGVAVSAGNRRNKRKGYETISLKKQNIYDTDISGYDYIYMFLMPNIMGDIEERLETHLDEKTICIVAAFQLPTRTPFQEIQENNVSKIYLYKKQTTK